jgi:hypothetical protein
MSANPPTPENQQKGEPPLVTAQPKPGWGVNAGERRRPRPWRPVPSEPLLHFSVLNPGHDRVDAVWVSP